MASKHEVLSSNPIVTKKENRRRSRKRKVGELSPIQRLL
jgi:hypothetical protein